MEKTKLRGTLEASINKCKEENNANKNQRTERVNMQQIMIKGICEVSLNTTMIAPLTVLKQTQVRIGLIF